MVRGALLIGLAAAIAIICFTTFRAAQERAALRASQDRLVAYHGLTPMTHKRLAPDYTDKDGGLLADPPADPAQRLDPDTLVIAHYQDADADTQLVDWEAFLAHVAAATGKPVVRQEYLNSADDVAAVKAGKIHIVALHAADAPYVVNNAGFVPVAVLGTEAGAHGNHLDIAVGAKSKIESLADLREHTLTCTTPDSITGYRAAIAILAEEASMRPDVDYAINFSFGQKRSIQGLVEGDFEVAALSDDKVQSMLGKGSIDKEDFRVIYESQVIPRLTIGYIYNLTPELAGKLSAAVLSFANQGGAVDDSTGQPMRFLASDYQKDFEFVRKIDDSFDPRFHKRPSVPPAPAAEQTAPAAEQTGPAVEPAAPPAAAPA